MRAFYLYKWAGFIAMNCLDCLCNIKRTKLAHKLSHSISSGYLTFILIHLNTSI
jgi:hypothetical protein